MKRMDRIEQTIINALFDNPNASRFKEFCENTKGGDFKEPLNMTLPHGEKKAARVQKKKEE